jgi:pimeloyl-ACP methyl ester carboxylesterase
MRTELVSIATDGQSLDGLYYEPADGRCSGAVLLMHGNTMNFYVGAPRFLPPVLTRLGLACLAYNRRGHDILSTRDSRMPEGGAFQTAAEAIADNNFAAAWLGARGHAAPVVIGHSNGGMLAVHHVAEHPETRALVLLSAHGGGASILRRSSAAGLMAHDRVDEYLAEAARLVAEGRPRELILMPGWWYAITAESLLDRDRNTPSVLELAPRITCPVLYLRGDQEPKDMYPAEAFAERAGGPCDVRIVADCDHFYNGREDAVAALVADWLRLQLPS